MGGQAFAAHFPTPRMSLAIYKHVLTQTQTILRNYYTNVSSAIEGPGKTTYGDVDVLVAGPLPHAFPPGTPVAEKLKQALHAKACIQDKGNPTMNFAVPWPRDVASIEHESEEKAQISDENDTWENNTQELNWELFHSAHGDLWNILGTTIRPYGLTVNNHGLYIRIQEIEIVERKKSMVFLTDEPSRVLDFLGLDEEKWWRPFGSQEEMFEYAGTCRMVWVKEEVDVVEGEGEEKEEKGEEKEKKKLKHNDRRRLAQRPIFKAWFEDFVPRCLKEGKYDIPRTTREQILTDAFEKFGIEEEYNTKLKEWSYTRHIDELTRDAIKKTIPVDGVDGQLRAAAIRTLKGIILEGEEFEGKIPDAVVKDENGFYDLEVVKRFVGENWEEAGRIGMGRQHVRAREAMIAKAEKRKKEKELGDGIE
ncbi:hypothetical protein CJF32_00011060 [Rutstroemia sp. NJR-2017a WRK4]|nr:hypothetical protein CJF32_00011060 [Rutstroemia sp. NJR-2017a WRK4]